MAFIRKIKGSLVQMERAEYIGEETYLFYDIETGCIYRHNGLPGGELIASCFGGGGTGEQNVDEYPTVGDFPAVGMQNVIYIAADTNIIYRWDTTGAAYVPLTAEAGSDNVESYPGLGSFPATGEANVIYIAEDTNLLYRWDGAAYVPVGGNTDSHEYGTVTIPASSTATLYSTVPAGNLSLKFIISAVDTVNGDFATAEVLGSYKSLDNAVSHNHYSLLGDKIKYKPELVYSGPDVQLNIVNNEVNPVTVNVIRIPTQPL